MRSETNNGAGKEAGMGARNWSGPNGARVSRATAETAERSTRNAELEGASGMIEPQKKSGPDRCANTGSGPTPFPSLRTMKGGDVSMPDQDTASTHPSASSADLARRALAYPGLHHIRAVVALLVPAGEIVPPGGVL